MHKKRIRDTVYYYTSVRENGRIKTIYLGRTKEEAKKRERGLNKASKLSSINIVNNRFFAYVFLVIFIVLVLFLFRGFIVGYVIFEGTEVLFPRGELTLTFQTDELAFQSQDFLPKDTLIEISLGDQSSIITIEEFLKRSGSDLKLKTGNFHLSGTELSGYGVGYGFGDKKNYYPDVNFQFILNAYASEITEDEKLIFMGYEIINGTCNSNKHYSANVGDLIDQENAISYSVNLVPGSVSSGNRILPDSYVSLELNRDVVTAETDYLESWKGFGENRTISLDLSELGIFLPEEPGNYILRLRVVYDETVLKETEKNITVPEGFLVDSDEGRGKFYLKGKHI